MTIELRDVELHLIINKTKVEAQKKKMNTTGI